MKNQTLVDPVKMLPLFSKLSEIIPKEIKKLLIFV